MYNWRKTFRFPRMGVMDSAPLWWSLTPRLLCERTFTLICDRSSIGADFECEPGISVEWHLSVSPLPPRWAREKVQQLFEQGSSLRHALSPLWLARSCATVQLYKLCRLEELAESPAGIASVSPRGETLPSEGRKKKRGFARFCTLVLQSDLEMQSCARSWGIFLAKSVNPSAPCRHLSDKSRVVWKLRCRNRNSAASAARGVRTSAALSSRQIERILPRHDDFAERHIGPGEREKREMLDALGLEVWFTTPPHIVWAQKQASTSPSWGNLYFFVVTSFFFSYWFVNHFPPQSIDQLIENTVPSSIRMLRSMKMDDPVCKFILIHFFFNRCTNLFIWHPPTKSQPSTPVCQAPI